MIKPQLIVICGPTASGKTALAVDVARRFGGEVVSADSMQVYRGMDIGTARPTAEEMGDIPHHMMGCAGIGENYSTAVYRDQARACIRDIDGRGRLPILCGGTGLYISATVYPLDFSNAGADMDYRKELAEYAEHFGTVALYGKLLELDPEAAKSIHPNNVKRVIRALERIHSSNHDDTAKGQQIFNGEPLYDLVWIGLTMDRAMLYKRIEARVDNMMHQGLLEEVEMLSAKYSRDSIAFQALGYKELLDYLDGSTTLDKAIEQIKTGTRNYAKRQLTWFRRENKIKWFNTAEYASHQILEEAVFGYIQSSLHNS